MLNSGSAISSILFRFAATGETRGQITLESPDRMEETAAFRPPRRSRVRSEGGHVRDKPRENKRWAGLAGDGSPAPLFRCQGQRRPAKRPAMTDTPPDHLSIDPASPYFDQATLERGIGIRFKGAERRDVEEYSISEGWVRVQAGKSVDRKGQPLTIKLTGPVEAWYEDLGENPPVAKKG